MGFQNYRRSHNRLVAGSSPAWPIQKKDTLSGVFFVFQGLLFPILCGQLVPQAVVDALLCQQLVMGAALHDLSLIHI